MQCRRRLPIPLCALFPGACILLLLDAAVRATLRGMRFDHRRFRWPTACGTPFASSVILFVVVAVVSAMLWRHGAAAQRFAAWDVPIMLDGGWRIFQGQVPHVDFHTPLGPVTYLIVAMGMWAVGPHADAMACANAIVFAAFSIWAWALLRSRVIPTLAVLGTLCVGFQVAATSVIGFRFVDSGYAAIYNRYGLALVSLLFVETFLRPTPQNSRWLSLAGGFSTGILLTLLFFLKANYFGVGVMAVALGAIMVSYDPIRWLAIGMGAFVSLLPMLAYLQFDIHAIWADIEMGRATVASRLSLNPSLGKFLPAATLAPVFIVFTLWAVTGVSADVSRRWLAPKFAQGIIVLFIVFAQFLLYWTNGQLFFASLFPLAAVVCLQGHCDCLEEGVTERGERGRKATFHWSGSRAAAPLLATFVIGSVMVPEIASVCYSLVSDRVVLRRMQAEPGLRTDTMLNTPSLQSMLIVGSPHYVASVNDGFDLLGTYSRSGEKVLAFNYTNPFSFGLLRPSPRGDAVWWDWFGTFARLAHPEPGKVFADVSVVMEPKIPIRDATLLNELYRPTLDGMFYRAGESSHWIIYRRRN